MKVIVDKKDLHGNHLMVWYDMPTRKYTVKVYNRDGHGKTKEFESFLPPFNGVSDRDQLRIVDISEQLAIDLGAKPFEEIVKEEEKAKRS